jgi:hypothetical protein
MAYYDMYRTLLQKFVPYTSIVHAGRRRRFSNQLFVVLMLTICLRQTADGVVNRLLSSCSSATLVTERDKLRELMPAFIHLPFVNVLNPLSLLSMHALATPYSLSIRFTTIKVTMSAYYIFPVN